MNDELTPIGEPEYRVILAVSRDMVVVTEADAPQYYRLGGDGLFVRCSEDEAHSPGVKRLLPGDGLTVRITASFASKDKPAWWDAAWVVGIRPQAGQEGRDGRERIRGSSSCNPRGVASARQSSLVQRGLG